MLSCDCLDHSVHPDVRFGHQHVKVLYWEKGLYNLDPYVTCYIVTSVCYISGSICYIVTTEWYNKITRYYIVVVEWHILRA